ncbi:MAG: cytochrome C [Rhodanobacteraceae bacterium]
MNRSTSTAIKTDSSSPSFHRIFVYLICTALAIFAGRSQAVPSFARQTQLPCSSCHVGAFGPQLTPFGRQFKLMGYTIKSGDGASAPVSMMLIESFTHTSKAQAEAPADGYSRNNNTELQQASLFLAGRISDHLGVFAQATYEDAAGVMGWDNIDLRYARTFTAGKHSGIWGLSLNNNPTVTDVFNTAPAWTWPFTSADLSPGAPAVPLLVDGLGGQVVGINAYTQLDGSWYMEAGGYRSLSPSFLRKVNADFDGQISGVATYLRAARSWNLTGANIEVGGFALDTRRSLPGVNSVGNAVAMSGPTDHFRDIGADASYQHFSKDGNTFTLNGLYVNEKQTLNATYGTGDSSNLHDSLDSLNVNGSYWFKDTWGATLGAFAYDGSADPGLYGDTPKPNTEGAMIEVDYNPFGKAGSWVQPNANVRIGAQYTAYSKFAGRSHNYDGTGRSASDNNTVYLYLWLAI